LKIPKKSQKFQSRDKIPKTVCPHYRITMTIVTITERILFSLGTNTTLKNAVVVGQRWHYANNFDRKCKFA